MHPRVDESDSGFPRRVVEATLRDHLRVRERPGIYFGDPHDGSGLHHLLWEVVANSLDQFLMGKAKRIDVRCLQNGSIEVTDDGPGIPLDVVEEVFTQHHFTPTFDDHAPHIHIGLVAGIGLACVCAGCDHVRVEIRGAQGRFTQEYTRGERQTVLERCGGPSESGTSVALLPDPTIFTTTTWDKPMIRRRMRELAALLPGLQTSFDGTHFGPCDIQALIPGESLVCVGTHEQRTARIAFFWSGVDGEPNIQSFANALPTQEGSHVKGLMEGLAAAMVRLGAPDRSWLWIYDRIARGMSAVVSVMLIDPSYGAPTRDRLVHPRVRELIKRTVAEQLPAQLPATMRDELLSRLR